MPKNWILPLSENASAAWSIEPCGTGFRGKACEQRGIGGARSDGRARIKQISALTRSKDARNLTEGVREEDAGNLQDWFGGDRSVELREEVLGLGTYGKTLTVLTCESSADDPDEEEELEKSWTPRWR